MYRKIFVALVAAFVVALPATASARAPRTDCGYKPYLTHYSQHYHAVKKLHGKRAPGRNIRKWGLSPKKHSSCKDIRRSIKVLKRMRFAGSTMLAAGRPYVPPAQIATLSAPAGGTLERIAACESGGNPSAIGGGGRFRGKYQFTYETWAGVGGSGDPAAASEGEQDRRAAILYARSGPGQWPVCGR